MSRSSTISSQPPTMHRCLRAHDPPSSAKLAPRKGNPASEEPGFSAKRFDCGGGAGTAQLMSHHMSHFAHTSDDERLSLVACSAFERTALDASCVHRFNQSDRSLPAACGASSQYTLGGRIGGMHVVSFRCGTLCVSLESTSAARTPYDGRLDRALSLGLSTNRVCTILITSPP
jgi:hypothetical protein